MTFEEYAHYVEKAANALKGLAGNTDASPAEKVAIRAAVDLLGLSVLKLGEIAHHLDRSAAAHEAMAQLAAVDINATVDDEVAARLETKVTEEMQKRTERSYFGKPGG